MQAISAVFRIFVAVLLVGGLGSCRTLESLGGREAEAAAEAQDGAEPTAPAAAATILPVGVVHHVDEAGGFLLIRSSRGLQIEAGTPLTVRGEQGEPVASLRVSPARKGSFLTADILEGVPQKGQTATMEHRPEPFGAAGVAAEDFSDPNAIQVLE